MLLNETWLSECHHKVFDWLEVGRRVGSQSLVNYCTIVTKVVFILFRCVSISDRIITFVLGLFIFIQHGSYQRKLPDFLRFYISNTRLLFCAIESIVVSIAVYFFFN